MGIFNNNESTGFAVLQHDFEEQEIAFRHHEDSITSGSVLFVQPGQEAVLVKEGDQDGPYTSGRYTLTTESIPFLNKHFNKTYGDKNAFKCFVYFVNKDKPFEMLWGTNHQIKVRDPHTNRLIRVFGRGSIAFTIDNSLKFIATMNGQLINFTADDISKFLYYKSIEHIMTYISQALQQVKISFIEIESHLTEISQTIKNSLTSQHIYENYGLKIASFSLITIDINEDDFKQLQEEENELEKKRREAELEAFTMRQRGFAEADVMKEKGIYFDKERSYDVMEAAAKNESSAGGSSFVGAGVGLGVGLGVAGGIGSAVGNMASNAFTNVSNHPTGSDAVTCSKCGARNAPGAKFCNTCGEKLLSGIPCPACGAENPFGSKFCSSCGTSLATRKIKCDICGTENYVTAKFCSGCGKKLGGE